MTFAGRPLSWSLSGVKQTSLVALHMSANTQSGHHVRDAQRYLCSLLNFFVGPRVSGLIGTGRNQTRALQ
jgi:hypothetical protein